MVAHAILFIVLPLAVAWFAGVTAYLPPYSLPAPKTEPVEPEFEAEVRAFLAQHSEPDAAAGKRMVTGVRGAPSLEPIRGISLRRLHLLAFTAPFPEPQDARNRGCCRGSEREE